MGKKIVILNGSPRKAGNTAALTAEFTKGAKEAGNTVTEFFLDGMDIHGCKGCFGGHSSRECPCVQRDDMDKIYPAVDRLFALEEGDGNLLRGHGRASALLMAAEGNGFEDVLLYYDHLMEHLKWENLGTVLAGGNGHVGDIEGKPELQKAYELGNSIQ